MTKTIAGVDLAAVLLGSPLGHDGAIGLTISRRTPGSRGADPSAGTNPNTVSHPVRGYVHAARTLRLIGQVRKSVRAYAVYGASLPVGFEPRVEDQVVHGTATYKVVDEAHDGQDAVWLLFCEGPG